MKSHLFLGNSLTLHANRLSALIMFSLSIEHRTELAAVLFSWFHQSAGRHLRAGGQSEAGTPGCPRKGSCDSHDEGSPLISLNPREQTGKTVLVGEQEVPRAPKYKNKAEFSP